MSRKIGIYLSPEDLELSQKLEEFGYGAVHVDRADGLSDLLVHTIEIGSSGMNLIASYLAVKAVSRSSYIKDGFSKKPLDTEQISELSSDDQ